MIVDHLGVEYNEIYILRPTIICDYNFMNWCNIHFTLKLTCVLQPPIITGHSYYDHGMVSFLPSDQYLY